MTKTVLDNGDELESALVVVGVGARPNTQLLKGQLDVEDQKPGGIPVGLTLIPNRPSRVTSVNPNMQLLRGQVNVGTGSPEASQWVYKSSRCPDCVGDALEPRSCSGVCGCCCTRFGPCPQAHLLSCSFLLLGCLTAADSEPDACAVGDIAFCPLFASL